MRKLEDQVNHLTTQYESLKTAHEEISAAHSKLTHLIEILTEEDVLGAAKDKNDRGGNAQLPKMNEGLFRKLLLIIRAEVVGSSTSGNARHRLMEEISTGETEDILGE